MRAAARLRAAGRVVAVLLGSAGRAVRRRLCVSLRSGSKLTSFSVVRGPNSISARVRVEAFQVVINVPKYTMAQWRA